jgi:2-keto-3-deoxy-L-rhamnonate aldolase RhmA
LISGSSLVSRILSTSTGPSIRPAFDVKSIERRTLATASKARKPCRFALGADPGRARELAARGFGFLVLGNDTSMLAAAAATLVTQTRG